MEVGFEEDSSENDKLLKDGRRRLLLPLLSKGSSGGITSRLSVSSPVGVCKVTGLLFFERNDEL